MGKIETAGPVPLDAVAGYLFPAERPSLPLRAVAQTDHPVGAGEAGIDRGNDDGEVGEVAVLEHLRHRGVFASVGGADLHPLGLLRAVPADVVHVLAARRLVAAHRLAFGDSSGRLHGDGALGHLRNELADDRVGLEELAETHERAAVHVTVRVRDDLERDLGIGSVRIVAPHVAVDARSARRRADGPEGEGVLLRELPDPGEPLNHGLLGETELDVVLRALLELVTVFMISGYMSGEMSRRTPPTVFIP